jgi:hypothetical protein
MVSRPSNALTSLRPCRPRYSVSLSAPAALFVIGVVGTSINVAASFRFIRRRVPQAHLLDIIASAAGALCYLIAAIVLTQDAVSIRSWINHQDAELVFDADLGSNFFGLLWTMFVFQFFITVLMLLADHARKGKPPTTSQAENEEPPPYEAASSQVELQSVGEMLRR